MIAKYQREAYLLNMLNSVDQISLSEVMSTLDISEATARRLFVQMEKNGTAVRRFGGIRAANTARNAATAQIKDAYAKEKLHIGRMAAMFIENDDTIFLGSSSTVFQMALALSVRINAMEFASINIITNSIANAQAFTSTPNCRIILLGGEYDSLRQDFSGALTEKSLEGFHFTKSFFGCDGVTSIKGFSMNHVGLATLNARVLAHSDSSCVLLDHSKFGRQSLISYASLREINAIVTNREPENDVSSALHNAGIRVNVIG